MLEAEDFRDPLLEENMYVCTCGYASELVTTTILRVKRPSRMLRLEFLGFSR